MRGGGGVAVGVGKVGVRMGFVSWVRSYKRWADLCAVNKVEQDARIYMCISLHDIVHNPAVILKY